MSLSTADWTQHSIGEDQSSQDKQVISSPPEVSITLLINHIKFKLWTCLIILLKQAIQENNSESKLPTDGEVTSHEEDTEHQSPSCNQDLYAVADQNTKGINQNDSSSNQQQERNVYIDILEYCNDDEDDDSDDPAEFLEISCNTLSYERFFPGRILGNTFTVKNIGYKACTFSLSFDNSNIDTNLVKEKMLDYYSWEGSGSFEKAYTKHLVNGVCASEENLSVWYIEDPNTKRLTKSIEMELESEDEYEFIVVLKSPSINKQTLFTANVIVNNFLNQTKQKVFWFGCMEKWKLTCPKELYNLKLNSKIIKVVMKRNHAAPIKLLLENKGDMQIVGNFQSIEMDKSIQFYIPRERVTIDSNSRSILEIKAVHKADSQNSEDNSQCKPEVIHKLVIAKIKDCELKYSLIFEITVV